MDLKNKRVLVVGMAKSGIPTVKALWSIGAKVSINDIKSKEELKEILEEIEDYCSELILGMHPINLDCFDLIIVSPGVPTDLTFIKNAKFKNIPLMGELELAYRLSKGKYIGITGTNGKTTTTALTGEIFKNASVETFIVGNIGLAAISKALETNESTVLVTEVSSFQLETIEEFRPCISAILNITPDHLNRHETMDAYIDAKSNIFKNQRDNDILILNYDNVITRDLYDKADCKVIYFSRKEDLEEGVYVRDNKIFVSGEGKIEEICSTEDINMPGNHNIENALAATAISYYFGIDKLIIKNTLESFKGVEHRIEFVDTIHGVRFINDSKGTNPDASIKAIEAIKEPIILIAGGMDKESSFKEFVNSFTGKVKKLILIGETAELIKNEATKKGFDNIIIVSGMDKAVRTAYNSAEKGDTVLLSPACASWDMYESFEHRGQHFKECVYTLRR